MDDLDSDENSAVDTPESIAIKVFACQNPKKDENENERATEYRIAKRYFRYVTQFNFQPPQSNTTLFCMTTEYIRGLPIDAEPVKDVTLYRFNKSLTFSDCISIAAQISLALYSLHRTSPTTGPGMIHRDLSVANVLLSKRPKITARVIDYGLAILNEATDPNQEALFNQPELNGVNPRMIATQEEQKKEGKLPKWGTKSDVFALGILLLTLFGQTDALKNRKKVCLDCRKDLSVDLDQLYSDRIKFDQDLAQFDQGKTPLIVRQLVGYFMKRMLYVDPQGQGYPERPTSKDNLQFFIWMHQICILLDTDQVQREEYRQLIAKCRLLLEGLWKKDFRAYIDDLVNFIVDIPLTEYILPEKLHAYLTTLPTYIHPEEQQALNNANLPADAFSDAIRNGKLVRPLLNQIWQYPELLQITYRLYQQHPIPSDFQMMLAQSDMLTIQLGLKLMLSITNIRVRDWLQGYLTKSPQEKSTFPIDTLSYDDTFVLYKLMRFEETTLLYLTGMSALTNLREKLFASLFHELDQYEQQFATRRTRFFCSTIADEKQAILVLKEAFNHYFSTFDPDFFCNPRYKNQVSTLTHNKLGELTKPLFANMQSFGLNLANPIPPNPKSFPEKNINKSFSVR